MTVKQVYVPSRQSKSAYHRSGLGFLINRVYISTFCETETFRYFALMLKTFSVLVDLRGKPTSKKHLNAKPHHLQTPYFVSVFKTDNPELCMDRPPFSVVYNSSILPKCYGEACMCV